MAAISGSMWSLKTAVVPEVKNNIKMFIQISNILIF